MTEKNTRVSVMSRLAVGAATMALLTMTAPPATAAVGSLSEGDGVQHHVPGPAGSPDPPCASYHYYEATLAYENGDVEIQTPVAGGAKVHYKGPAESTVSSHPGVAWGEGPPGTYEFCGGAGPPYTVGSQTNMPPPKWGTGRINGSYAENGRAYTLSCEPDSNSEGTYTRDIGDITIELRNHTCAATQTTNTAAGPVTVFAMEPDVHMTLKWKIPPLTNPVTGDEVLFPPDNKPHGACDRPIAPDTCVVTNGRVDFKP